MPQIREYQTDDWASVWAIIEPVFRAGETFPMAPDISEQQAFDAWILAPDATLVYVNDDDGVLGTYYIKPNQPPLGAHVCNCGYIVSTAARGRGIGSAMCVHSQEKAWSMGFRSMQYNLVVTTNEPSVRLWKKHGFAVVGTLPKAFHHLKLGFVDALVMYKELAP